MSGSASRPMRKVVVWAEADVARPARRSAAVAASRQICIARIVITRTPSVVQSQVQPKFSAKASSLALDPDYEHLGGVELPAWFEKDLAVKAAVSRSSDAERVPSRAATANAGSSPTLWQAAAWPPPSATSAGRSVRQRSMT